MVNRISHVASILLALGILLVAFSQLMGRFVPDSAILIARVRLDGDIRPYGVDMRTGTTGAITLPSASPQPTNPYTIRSFREDGYIYRTLINDNTGEEIDLTRYRPSTVTSGVHWSDDFTKIWVVFGGEERDTTRIQTFDTQGNLMSDWQYAFAASALVRDEGSPYMMLQGDAYEFNRSVGFVRETYLVDLRTGDWIDLPRKVLNFYEWSPNGEWLFAIFFDEPRPVGHVGFMWFNPASGKHTIITHDIAGFFHEWSPNSTSATYGIITDTRTLEREVYALNLEAQTEALILETNISTIATFSADGTMLITRENNDDAAIIHRTDMQSLETSTIGTIEANADNLTISPNHRILAYTVRDGDTVTLHILNLQRGVSQSFAYLPQSTYFLTWE